MDFLSKDKQYCKIDIIHLMYIANILEYSSVIKKVGNNGKVLSGDCYFAQNNTISKKQSSNELWLCGLFGLNYLHHSLEKNTCHIIGTNSKNQIGNGSGFLIDHSYILTCRHNVKMDNIEVHISGQIFKILNIYEDEKYDIAIIEIDRSIDNNFVFPVFNKGGILEDVLVMGYPPIPMSRDSYLLSQKGEINAIVKDYNDCSCLIISSTTRPGNSGGPVISKKGYLVGMIFISTNSSESFGKTSETKTIDPNNSQYFWAIDGKVLYDSAKALLPKINIDFEDDPKLI